MLAAGMAGLSLSNAQEGEAIPGAKVSPLKPTDAVASDPRLDLVGKVPLQVEVRPANDMKQEDRDLVASSTAAIRKRAEFHDLGFDHGNWLQSQLDCPALPRHLFLRFTLDQGAGDVSMFAASIPREQGGRVQVIPISRRGYSPISPAPVNKATIGAFNEIRAEEHVGEKADWAALTMCFAALSSARWDEPKSALTLKLAGPDTLQLGERGEVIVAMELDSPAPGRWVVTFDRKGELEKTEYTQFGPENWHLLPPTQTEIRGKPLPTGAIDAGKPLPSGPVPTGRTIPPGQEPNGRTIPPTSTGDSPNKPQ